MAKNKENVPPQTIEEAHALIEEQNKIIADQNTLIEEQNGIIADQSKQIEKLETKVSTGASAPSVTIRKKSYQVVASVKHVGKNLTPAEVAQDKSLCEKLLAIEGQNILVEEK